MTSMKTTSPIRSAFAGVLLAGSALLLPMLPASAQIIFQENFDYPAGTTGTLSIDNYGWLAWTNAGVNVTANTAITNGGKNYWAGVEDGYLKGFGSGDTTNARYHMVYKELGAGLTIANGTEITWTMGNNATYAQLRLLVQVGGTAGDVTSGQWFVSSGDWFQSTTLFAANNDAGFAAADPVALTKSFTFTTDKNSWRTLTIDPTQTDESWLTLGSTSTTNLPSNTITSIGFLTGISNAASVFRLDSLTVGTAIPEPTVSALLLAAVGCAAFVFVRRRK
ncbi:PEP-CTERM putative exosortase interaction domain-containing protein [Opitutaceae bacterium TAV1]|nr:PEP-CTERM putative exosortase interaction domain-containing protein [Opitutaceae bacterium TAV1]